MNTDLIKLSKLVSHALRHAPEAYGLIIDNDGWVTLSDLILSLKANGFPNIELEDILTMIEKSEKKRHEIYGDKIRAYYGHSLSEKILKISQSPPEVLYHGTTTKAIESIIKSGLLPMERQYVHLSVDVETALRVSSRKRGEPVVLNIKAQEAFNEGIEFFKEVNGIWLSSAIPQIYISNI